MRASSDVRTVTVVLAGLLLAAVAAPLRAEDEKPKPLWDLKVGFSYVATGGNTSTKTAGADVSFHRRWTLWSLQAAADAVRATDNGVTTAERYTAGVRVNRAISERMSLTAGWQGDRAPLAGFDLRSVTDAGVQWQAYASDAWTLDTIAAATWTREVPVEGDTSNRGGVMAQARSAVTLSDTASTTQNVTFYQSVRDSKRWRLDAVAALQAAVNAHLAVKFSYEFRYDNQPVPGFGKTDTITKASLVVNLASKRNLATPAP